MIPEIKYEQPSQLFNEAEWLRLLFLISDTVAWIEEMERSLMYQLPVVHKANSFAKPGIYRQPHWHPYPKSMTINWHAIPVAVSSPLL